MNELNQIIGILIASLVHEVHGRSISYYLQYESRLLKPLPHITFYTKTPKFQGKIKRIKYIVIAFRIEDGSVSRGN